MHALIEDPLPRLELLERLKDDTSETVRRSVANHLNDVAKDHPAVVTDLCKRWAAEASPERVALIRHALRTLVKQGDAAALEILGLAGSGVRLPLAAASSETRDALREALEISGTTA